MIQIQLPDGTIAEFPAGTPDSVIEQVLAQEYSRALAENQPSRDMAKRAADARAAVRAGVTPQSTPEQAAIDQSVEDRIALSANPTAVNAILTGAQGLPFVGEWVDNIGDAMGIGDTVRGIQNAMEREHPVASTALQVGGGILGAIPAVALAGPSIIAKAPASMAGKIVAGVLGGAFGGGVEGAVSGAGAGDDGNRGESAFRRGLLGAVLGGGIGGAMPMIANGISKGADVVQDVISRQRRTLPGLSREATEQVLLRGQGDDIATDGVARIRAAGPDAMLADAGPSFGALTDQAASMSMRGGKIARDAVEDRAAASSSRLAQTFDNVMGGPEGQAALSNAVRASRQPGIKAAYERAYSTPINYAAPEGQAIERILSRLPAGRAQEALRKAQDRMAYDGLPNAQIMAQIAPDGSVQFMRLPNVMEVDYIKRAFSEIAQDGTDPITGRMTSDAAFAGRIAGDLKRALGDAVPDYRTALAEASDEFGLQDALTLGRKLLSPGTTREAVKDWAATATPVEKKALAAGLRSQIDETMANVKRALSDGNVDARQAAQVVKDMSSDAAREKIGEVFGAAEADRIFKALDEAGAALDLRAGIAKNSMTAPRLAGDALLKTSRQYSPGEIARETVSGGILQGPRRLAQIAAGNTPADIAARDEALYAELAQYLTGARGPDAVQRAQEITGLLNYLPAANAVSARAGQIGAGGLGLLGHLSTTRSQTVRGR